jgi:hypothetical protein
MYNFWKIVLLCSSTKAVRNEFGFRNAGVDIKLRKLTNAGVVTENSLKIYPGITAIVKRKFWELNIR